MADHDDISMDNIPARRHARKLMRIGLPAGCVVRRGAYVSATSGPWAVCY